MPALDQLLAQNANDTTTEAALAQLFARWNLTYAPNRGRGCEQASAQGLECLFQKGSWAQLRTLNRPAILTLTDDVGRTHQVVLAALDDESRKRLDALAKALNGRPALSRPANWSRIAAPRSFGVRFGSTFARTW